MIRQFAGVSNTSTLYKRGIRVCTGTGLGAALSTCIQVRFYFPFPGMYQRFSYACVPEPRLVSVRTQFFPPAANFPADLAFAPVETVQVLNAICAHRYLIWIGSDQEKTFGPTIANLIHRHLGKERCCLWDSKARGTGVMNKACCTLRC
jgi:hypothetical protein